MSENPLRKWRNDRGLNLDQACELFKQHGKPISTAKLSRMERDQDIPNEDLPDVIAVTGIPAAELAPGLAKLFSAESIA